MIPRRTTRRKTTAPLTPFQREMIQHLHKKKFDEKKIAELVECSVRAVRFWSKQKTTKNQPGQGRPRILTPQNDRRIKRIAKKYPHRGTDSFTPRINKKLQTPVTSRTIRNSITRSGGKWDLPKTDIILTDSQTTDREKWARSKKRKRTWNNDRFYDESFYKLENQSKKRRIFVDDPQKKKKKYSRMLKFEAFISAKGKTDLHFWTGRRDTKHFKQHMRETHVPELLSRSRTYQMSDPTVYFDRAPCHTSKKAKEYLSTTGLRTELFPPKPCDINIIEGCWEEIKRKTRAKNPKTLKEAEKYLTRFWNEISRDDLRNKFDGVRKRVTAVRKKKGGKTKYWSTCKK